MMIGGVIISISYLFALITKGLENPLYHIIYIFLAIGIFILGYGNFKGMKWAWIITIIYFSIYIVAILINIMISEDKAFSIGNSNFGIIFGIAVLYDFTRLSAKMFFGIDFNFIDILK